MRAPRWTAVPVAVVALLAGCAPASDPAATPSEPAPALQRFHDQEPSWGPCAPFAVTPDDEAPYADPALECARIEVPLDYADPDGETASIGVLRRPASDPDRRIGSLVTNPGGPGASGMNLLATSIAPEAAEGELAQRFDLVGFDPRGIGSSEPVVDCLTDAERDAERVDLLGTPQERLRTAEAESREYVERCVARVGEEVLAGVGTRDVARDLDILRSALGDERLTFLGYSYGTLIGARYAQAFPGRVRALVLDGAVDPARDPVEAVIAQHAGFQGAFDAFAADCASRPGCPLGADPAQATERFQELTRALLEQPADAAGGRELGYSDALTGVTQALYAREAWPVLEMGLTELTAGRGRVLMLLADLYEERADDGSYSNLHEAFTAVHCVDAPALTDPQQLVELDRTLREVAPFRDDGLGPLPARDPCAFWPVPETSEPTFPSVDGLPPTLVVSTTGDPATPYQAGVDLAEGLGAGLLTVQGDQHLAVLRGLPCVDEIVTRYLIDVEPVPDDASCAR